MRRVLSALLLALAAVTGATAQETCASDHLLVTGSVVEGDLGTPLSGSIILVDRLDEGRWVNVATAETDAAGRYQVCVDPSSADSLRLQANSLGAPGDPVTVQIDRHDSPPEVALSVYLDRTGGATSAEIDVREGPAGERFRIFGRVTGIEYGEPITGARVRLVSGAGETITGTDGSFSLLSGEKADTVVIEHFGYKTGRALVEPLSGSGVMVDARLPAQPVELEPIVVGVSYHPRLRARGFYDRRERGEALGLGYFFGEKEIREQMAVRISQLIERVPMMETVRICTPYCMVLPKVATAPSKIGGNSRTGYFRSPCPADVYVNGTRVRMFYFDAANRLIVQMGIDELGIPAELIGIEVYRRASELPAEFGGTMEGCGAVAIWTK